MLPSPLKDILMNYRDQIENRPSVMEKYKWLGDLLYHSGKEKIDLSDDIHIVASEVLGEL